MRSASPSGARARRPRAAEGCRAAASYLAAAEHGCDLVTAHPIEVVRHLDLSAKEAEPPALPRQAGLAGDEVERVKGYRPESQAAANDELRAALELIGSGRFAPGDIFEPGPFFLLLRLSAATTAGGHPLGDRGAGGEDSGDVGKHLRLIP
jgi:hypothetical protein